MEANIKNVLIIEDHPDALEVLKSVAIRAFHQAQIDTGTSVAQGLTMLKATMFEVALIDLGLPDGNGIELVRYIAKHSPATLTIVTTIFDDESHLFNALQAGASGYLLKGHSPDELFNYFVEAISGRPPLSPSIAQSMLGYFHKTGLDSVSSSNQLAAEPPVNLTERETEILRLIAKGCQAKDVSRLLEISINTVYVHIKNLYKKLDVTNRAEATAAAVRLQLYAPN